MAAPFQPPSDIWEVNQSLQLDEHLDGDRDPRWVDTERARGEYSLRRLYRTLGVDRTQRRLTAPAHGYYLFCGHRGCGKSTELRRIAHELQMIKLLNSDGSGHQEGRTAMLEMLHRRAASGLFDDAVAERLIEHSGGHPRDLLRLLLNAFKHAEHDRFDAPSAGQAIREMANDFRRILIPDDYRLLATIDAGQPPPSDSDRVRYLLYNLALLEYNDFYWRSHPAIRSTQEYLAARDALAESDE